MLPYLHLFKYYYIIKFSQSNNNNTNNQLLNQLNCLSVNIRGLTKEKLQNLKIFIHKQLIKLVFLQEWRIHDNPTIKINRRACSVPLE